MKGSRIAAAVIVVAAAAWIGSGVIGKDERRAAEVTAALQKKEAEAPRFRVSVVPAKVEMHARRVVVSGRTEADKRATAVARAPGVIVDLKVRRGAVVKTGDVVAVLSDEAREAMVTQAEAKLEQRKIELKAKLKLIETGNYPSINKPQLEAELRAAEASLAQAEAERDKSQVRAPIDGIVNSVPVENGQALQPGANVAEIIALDPMLAVVEIAERQLGGVRVGDSATVKLVTGQKAEGRVRFIAPTASAQTRTYRVDVALNNPDLSIADGVTCEVALRLAPAEAARVPRSALTFSGEGKLGVRTVGSDGKVAFVPVSIVEDSLDQLWLAGVADGAKVIVQGQDFVKEGELVEPVAAGSTA
ncbi:efflux RND transporter periplasmic adaptor subunit [Chelatococcus sp. SYSU_G07232]|uniref:Efflux RND transporter periplasmic adaptor subunit n=1 Tax=Chelatococcus albus TaxID=3047466 RepID=A0ABT7ALE5_9HYPH|nr:efflux RND transporter periplasmic adaptor subunit [Chelatococcus sp. SYSU_G07232]MDJ1160199.1 efflux RND transporter periplasmic adaptor subunit [Chelatococcus sp. SYSU_G07232]